MKATTLLSSLVLLGATGLFDANAEISAKLDEERQYAGMLVRITGGRVWASPMATATRRPLNPTGDLLGDLAPTIVENPTQTNHPTAIWSHPNGPDYDLIFSRWTGAGWTPMQFVQTDNFTNEFEPRFGFSRQGRPYLVWWSDEGGVGAVYFSMFLESRWMTPIRVSTPNVDSRHADLTIMDELAIGVSYATPNGYMWRMVTIPNRSTITDDIDPKIRQEISID